MAIYTDGYISIQGARVYNIEQSLHKVRKGKLDWNKSPSSFLLFFSIGLPSWEWRMSIYPYRGFQKCIHHIKDSVCVSRWKWKGIRNDKLSGARLALRKTGRVSCKGIVYNRISNGKQSSVYSRRTMSKRRHCIDTIEFYCFSRQVFLFFIWCSENERQHESG